MDSNAGSYITSNFKNTGNVKFIKPVSINGGTALRSRTPMINRAATSKCFNYWENPDLYKEIKFKSSFMMYVL